MTVDELREYGLKDMDGNEIRNFLTNEGMGVLGLPTDQAPYIIPMSFGFDGQSRLYFSFFVGSDSSRKVELSRQAETASFLVYSADSIFFWESVLLTGKIGHLPENEWEAHLDTLDNAWHLDLFEKADTAGQLELYQFEIDDQVGLKSVGLPPGMEQKRSSNGPE